MTFMTWLSVQCVRWEEGYGLRAGRPQALGSGGHAGRGGEPTRTWPRAGRGEMVSKGARRCADAARLTFCSLALSLAASLAAPRRSPMELLLSLACSLLALAATSGGQRRAASVPSAVQSAVQRDSLLGSGGAGALDRLRHALDGVRGLVDDA
jgi:hypothetical protein